MFFTLSLSLYAAYRCMHTKKRTTTLGVLFKLIDSRSQRNYRFFGCKGTIIF